jgi:hypothetical protein
MRRGLPVVVPVGSRSGLPKPRVGRLSRAIVQTTPVRHLGLNS